MSDKVITFPSKQAPKKSKPLNIHEIEQIGFLTVDDRDLWVVDPEDLEKIMRFIIKEKIKIIEHAG